MASKFLRHRTWWVKFYHPVTGARIRESLETHDPARAELLRQCIELEVALSDPRFRAAEIPSHLRQEIDSWAANHTNLPGEAQQALIEVNEAPRPAPPTPAVRAQDCQQQTTIDEALKKYFAQIQEENAPMHVQNKVSILRRFLGDERVEQVLGFKKPAGRKALAPFFEGEFLGELTPSMLQDFMEQLPVTRKTKRHYREFFHHFIELCLNFGYLTPTNWHCPNPVAALPSYVTRNRRIVFLTAEQVEEQLRVLTPFPEIRMGVAIMIYAGLRRAETLWLTRDSISSDLSYISVLNRIDHEHDIESSLKTGERTVTILPPLAKLLQEYLPGLKSKWLVPARSGERWEGDNFAKNLRKKNEEAGIKWTCLHYRHTYATQRAAEGWPLFRIAKEMGNSAAVVEEYYAGFIRPSAPPACVPDGIGAPDALREFRLVQGGAA